MDDIKILITGSVGVGKSSIAYAITQFLRDKGFVTELTDNEIHGYEESYNTTRMEQLSRRLNIEIQTVQTLKD